MKTISLLTLLSMVSITACSKQERAARPARLTTTLLEHLPIAEQERVLGEPGEDAQRTRVLVDPHDVTAGLKDAPVVLVGFVNVVDENGWHALQALEDAQARNPLDVRVVLKPIVDPTSPLSNEVATLIAAAHEQGKSWELARCVARPDVALTQEWLDSCIGAVLDRTRLESARSIGVARTSQIADDVKRLHVTGAPTLFLNGYRIKGLPPPELLADGIAIAIKEAKHYANEAGLQRGAVYPALMRHASIPVEPSETAFN